MLNHGIALAAQSALSSLHVPSGRTRTADDERALEKLTGELRELADSIETVFGTETRKSEELRTRLAAARATIDSGVVDSAEKALKVSRALIEVAEIRKQLTAAPDPRENPFNVRELAPNPTDRANGYRKVIRFEIPPGGPLPEFNHRDTDGSRYSDNQYVSSDAEGYIDSISYVSRERDNGARYVIGLREGFEGKFFIFLGGKRFVVEAEGECRSHGGARKIPDISISADDLLEILQRQPPPKSGEPAAPDTDSKKELDALRKRLEESEKKNEELTKAMREKETQLRSALRETVTARFESAIAAELRAEKPVLVASTQFPGHYYFADEVIKDAPNLHLHIGPDPDKPGTLHYRLWTNPANTSQALRADKDAFRTLTPGWRSDPVTLTVDGKVRELTAETIGSGVKSEAFQKRMDEILDRVVAAVFPGTQTPKHRPLKEPALTASAKGEPKPGEGAHTETKSGPGSARLKQQSGGLVMLESERAAVRAAFREEMNDEVAKPAESKAVLASARFEGQYYRYTRAEVDPSLITYVYLREDPKNQGELQWRLAHDKKRNEYGFLGVIVDNDDDWHSIRDWKKAPLVFKIQKDSHSTSVEALAADKSALYTEFFRLHEAYLDRLEVIQRTGRRPSR